MRRRRVLLGLVLGALALVPVAVAWACNPQAHISLNSTSFSPGSSITVSGTYFPANAEITVSGPGGSDKVKASGGGAFTYTGFNAPAEPGSYTITASRPTGGYAPASFEVVAPAQAQQPAQSEPSGSTPAQSQTPAKSSPRAQTKAPAVQRSERVASSTPRRSSGAGGGTTPQRARPPVTIVQTQPGAQPVFSGSTATGAAAAGSSPRAVAPSRKSGGKSTGGRTATSTSPSEQTAFSDVWSGFEPGRTPTLATAGSSASDGGGSGLALGIGLLGFGVFALVGGLAVAEARRRRVA